LGCIEAEVQLSDMTKNPLNPLPMLHLYNADIAESRKNKMQTAVPLVLPNALCIQCRGHLGISCEASYRQSQSQGWTQATRRKVTKLSSELHRHPTSYLTTM